MDIVAIEHAIRRCTEMVLHVARTFDIVRRVRAALEFMEQSAVRLRHHLREHVQTAAMGHAEHNFLHAEIAAALDDLLKRRHERFAAIKAEALGAGIFHIDEFFEAFRLNKLVEDGALAFTREGDFLIRTFDAFLNPRLFGRIGNVHELPTDRRAIGALQDREHFADRSVFKPEHMIDKNLAIPIGFREAIARGIKLFMILAWFNRQRIEISMQMAAHTISADHHQRADGVTRRLHQFSRCNAALGVRLLLQLVGDDLVDLRPIAVERGNEFAIRWNRPMRLFPRSALSALFNCARIIIQRAEKLTPLGIHRGRIFLIPRIEIFDIGGVATVEKRSREKSVVLILACHSNHP